MNKIIDVKSLTKIYPGNIVAVDHINFYVKKGEIFGFLGPNGAGKTTTINMLNTLIPPTEGDAIIDKYSVREKPEKIRRLIGLVPQELTADDELTGWENIMLQASLYNLDKKNVIGKAGLLLKLIDLEDAAYRLVKTYSGGMRRRLELVMGLIHNPKILFLDEPTLGLDVQTRSKIWEYIKMLKQEYNMTIFMTTHYMDEADYLCDRIAIIDRGKIIAEGTPDKLKREIRGDLVVLTVNKYTDKIQEDLNKIPGYKDIKIGDNKITISAEKGEEALPTIMKILIANNISVKSVEVVKPSLEQVFLYLTGKKIREEEPMDMMKRKILKHRIR